MDRASAAFLLCLMVIITAQMKAQTEPLKVGRGVIVQTWVNHTGPFPFCLDTGLGGGLVISHRLARKLHLQKHGTSKIGDPSDKSSFEVPTVRLARISIGEIVLRNTEAVVQPESPLLEDC